MRYGQLVGVYKRTRARMDGTHEGGKDSSRIVNTGEAVSVLIDADVDYERLIIPSNLMEETTGLSTFHFVFKRI